MDCVVAEVVLAAVSACLLVLILAINLCECGVELGAEVRDFQGKGVFSMNS